MYHKQIFQELLLYSIYVLCCEHVSDSYNTYM